LGGTVNIISDESSSLFTKVVFPEDVAPTTVMIFGDLNRNSSALTSIVNDFLVNEIKIKVQLIKYK
jgi:hypothetical protein